MEVMVGQSCVGISKTAVDETDSYSAKQFRLILIFEKVA